MKKSILTKALVCGILASSFAIINCQKAPERKVTPTPAAKPDANPMAQCTEDIVKQLADHNAAVKAIQDKIDAAKTTPLKPEEKAPLDKQFQDMVLNSNKLYTAIRALGKDATPSLGCMEVNPNISGGSAPRTILEIQDANKKLSLVVAKLTGIANDLASQFVGGNKYDLSLSLTQMLSDKANYNGKEAISAGAVLNEADYLKMKDDKAKTSCVITAADEKPVAEHAVMVITKLDDPKPDATSKRMTSVLTAMIKGIAADTSPENTADRPVSFTCTLADQKDALEEVSLAFKGLATLKLDAEPAKDPAADKAAADKAAADKAAADQAAADKAAADKAAADGQAAAGPKSGDPTSGQPALDPAAAADTAKTEDAVKAQVITTTNSANRKIISR